VFDAERNSDRLTIRGTVVHGFGPKEMFDFDFGQPGSNAAFFLEQPGEAKPFRIEFERRQGVEAELRYEPDGRLTLLRSTWGAIR
jgi:hypothetical protein